MPKEKTVLFIGIHNHQPVGNFDRIFEFATERAYLPQLDHLESHPLVKSNLHYTGCLLEWLEEHRPELLDRVKVLVERGQVEILGGGFYEPIISVLPNGDAHGQLARLSEYVTNRFGKIPEGCWLAERVWEPNLPHLFNRAGLKYTVLDQSHFTSAGIERDRSHGYYMTEDLGLPLAVFPIDYRLRYTIPWEPVETTIEYLRQKHDEEPGRAWTFADDGEKFGSWPGTFDYVIKGGWLERFFSALEENSDWLETMHFGQWLKEKEATGSVYIPSSTYDEMLQWSLPPEIASQVESFAIELGERPEGRFVKVGFWRNFFAKYPEANHMHKRMLRTSQIVAEAAVSDEVRDSAQTKLYSAQCNCPYWHGVFGGLYLNFLRNETFKSLITAEKIIASESNRPPELGLESVDFDADGRDELLITTPEQNVFISPHRGGAIFEWDWLKTPTNLVNTLARRPEAYHAGSEDQMAYDRHPRWCLQVFFIAEDTLLTDFCAAKYVNMGDFTSGAYETKTTLTEGKIVILMQRRGTVSQNGAQIPVTVEKEISVGDDTIGCSYTITNTGDVPLSSLFGSEINIGLMAGDAPDRYYLLDDRKPKSHKLASTGEAANISKVSLVDEWQKVAVEYSFDRPARVWRYPIETLSLSEDGLETTFQSSAVLPLWEFSLEPAETWTVAVQLRAQTL